MALVCDYMMEPAMGRSRCIMISRELSLSESLTVSHARIKDTCTFRDKQTSTNMETHASLDYRHRQINYQPFKFSTGDRHRDERVEIIRRGVGLESKVGVQLYYKCTVPLDFPMHRAAWG